MVLILPRRMCFFSSIIRAVKMRQFLTLEMVPGVPARKLVLVGIPVDQK